MTEVSDTRARRGAGSRKALFLGLVILVGATPGMTQTGSYSTWNVGSNPSEACNRAWDDYNRQVAYICGGRTGRPGPFAAFGHSTDGNWTSTGGYRCTVSAGYECR